MFNLFNVMYSVNAYHKGMKLMKKRQYARAIEYFDKFIAKNPEHADAISERGVARFHVKDLQGALDDMNLAANLDPENPYRYSSRAYIRESNGDTEGAINDYKIAIQLDPEDAIAFNNLGLLEDKLGNRQESKKYFRRADELEGVNTMPSVEEKTRQEQLVRSLLEETNIKTEAEQLIAPPSPSLTKTMFSVFHSRSALKDFFKFVGQMIRRPFR